MCMQSYRCICVYALGGMCYCIYAINSTSRPIMQLSAAGSMLTNPVGHNHLITTHIIYDKHTTYSRKCTIHCLTPYVRLLFIYVTKQSMASFMSSGTSTPWPRRMYACGYGQCVVKISRSHKNPGRAYYACLNPMPCLTWIGWCDEPRQLNTE